MSKCYFELRKKSARGTDSLAADIMRHLHARQHLGKSLILTDHPSLAICRKQWLKLSRTIQKQRACTINADKILKYTHSIIHMQNMRFTQKPPLEDAEGDVFFLGGTEVQHVPANCYTVYIASPLAPELVKPLLDSLPGDALIVDYLHEYNWEHIRLKPKRLLEENVTKEWKTVNEFLVKSDITIDNLLETRLYSIEAIDDALDTLMMYPNRFLTVAESFHHTLEIARPLRIQKDMRNRYDTVMLLAHRVQALTSPTFTRRFLESYNEDDTFFLYDTSKKRFLGGSETITEAIQRHHAAGRKNLARALQKIA